MQKNHLLIFSSFLDIWENVEWPRFFGPHCTFTQHSRQILQSLVYIWQSYCKNKKSALFMIHSVEMWACVTRPNVTRNLTRPFLYCWNILANTIE